ncbi:MAG: amidohydrolase family protein, partial [Alphaproteobacteria bacterium]
MAERASVDGTADLLIRGADRVVAYDATTGSHVYLTDADVAVSDGRFSFVGHGFTGGADREVSGRGLMVMPGLIDLHSHPWSESMNRGFGEDMANACLHCTMYEHKPGWGDDMAGWLATASMAYAELLRSGVTTLTDMTTPYEGWIENFAASGLRGFVAPMMRSALWSLDSAGEVVGWNWFDDDGAESFARGLEAVDAAMAHKSGRMSAMVMPAQVDTCTERFLQDALAAARKRGIGMQTHACQVLPELWEMERRHAMSPVAWMEAIGVLGADVTLSHAPFLDHHSWLGNDSPTDLERLGKAGANVAHCPTVLTRSGVMLEDFRRYRQAGVTIAMGTDTAPQNMMEEMRMAAIMARAAAADPTAGTTRSVFEAATLGGAKALQRDDIGRIAVGACGDLVLVDLNHRDMAPGHDPIRALVFNAAERPVKDVYVGGEQVVADGRVLTVDETAMTQAMTAANQRAMAAYARFD